MKTILLILSLCLSAATLQAAPLFTADYYIGDPDRWLGKQVTVAVAELDLRNEGVHEDGTRQVLAYTYNQNDAGGFISLVGPAPVIARLAQLIGTTLQFNMSGVRTIMIKGRLSQEPTGEKRYFIYVEK